VWTESIEKGGFAFLLVSRDFAVPDLEPCFWIAPLQLMLVEHYTVKVWPNLNSMLVLHSTVFVLVQLDSALQYLFMKA
jgi:hypothetical protein